MHSARPIEIDTAIGRTPQDDPCRVDVETRRFERAAQERCHSERHAGITGSKGRAAILPEDAQALRFDDQKGMNMF